jgi:hypothetical protein
MKTPIRIFTLFLLFAFPQTTYAQNFKLKLFYDTDQSSYPGQILVGYLKDQIITGLIIRNDTSNFEYRGRILDKQKNEYIVFEYFNEPVGCTNLYLFAVKDFKVYASQSIQETEVPVIFSFDKSTLIMWVVSIYPPNCGKKTLISFNSKDMKKYKIDDLKGFKTHLSIDLF